jgi:hypothetical protein
VAVTIDIIRQFVGRDHGLAVVSVVRSDRTPASSLVNAGLVQHPVTGAECAAFVVRGDARKVAHLRSAPTVSIVWRHGWEWVGLTGPAQLIGPDDAAEGIDPDGIRQLLRAVFIGAGGTHDDWTAYDRVMLDERRLAVLVEPRRFSGNPRL